MSSFRSLLNSTIFCSALTVLLASCGIFNPYKPETSGLGYSEVQLDKNLWQVTFKGDISVKENDSANYAMLRCAEITLIMGYRYFSVTDKKATTKDAGVSNNFTTQPYNRYADNGIKETSDTTPRSTAVRIIRMFKKKPRDKNTYDAVSVCNLIGSKYEIICYSLRTKAKQHL